MATIIHRHPEGLRSRSLPLAALLALVAILLTIVAVQQFGGSDTASPKTFDVVSAAGTAYAGMLPRSDFATDNDWLKAHGFPPAAPTVAGTAFAGMLPRSDFASDNDWLKAHGFPPAAPAPAPKLTGDGS
ncbi:MAG: hypothetical protein HKN03_07410 [Acidimicrobiales bacterium]|nr:hypothetical protein [Acidimicrobiales bacterium]